jgi:hypothetical protein
MVREMKRRLKEAGLEVERLPIILLPRMVWRNVQSAWVRRVCGMLVVLCPCVRPKDAEPGHLGRALPAESEQISHGDKVRTQQPDSARSVSDAQRYVLGVNTKEQRHEEGRGYYLQPVSHLRRG